MANINADIYGLSEFVNDIKKQFINIPEDTLYMGTFGYTGEVYSNMLQNAVIMASEYSNEGIPVKAKFEKNIITHALSLGISNINATPAKMSILLGFMESDLVNSMRNDRFVFDKDSSIYIENFEFHTDYDIIINRNKLPNGEYTYTARYDITRKNPLSTTTNPYLTPPARMVVENEMFIYVQCDIRQYEQSKIYRKILTDNPIENKTLTFDFDSQLASFELDVTEGNNNIHLVPMYEGLYESTLERYCYYSYIDSSNIRIKFNRDSYEPRINSDVTIDLKTTQGAKGNFTYKNELSFNFNSEKYGYSNLVVTIKPIGNSEFGSDKKSIDDLKRMIPKEALSRGSITNTTDLNNFFNMIDTDLSKLYFYKKRDNQLERLYYSYILLKDSEGTIIPTNTIDIKIKETDFSSTENNKYIFNPGNIIFYDITKNPYGTVRVVDQNKKKSNARSLKINEKSTYEFIINGFDKLTPFKEIITTLNIRTDVLGTNGYTNTAVVVESSIPVDGKLSMIVKGSDNIEYDIIETGYWGKNGIAIPANYNKTSQFKTLCTVPGTYIVKLKLMDLDENIVLTEEIIELSVGGFVYTTPFMCVLNLNPLYISYYLNIIDMVKYLNFDYINQNCKLQFISTYANWKREYLVDRNTYKLNINMIQNISSDEGIIEKDDNGNIINVNMRVFAILYNDNIPYRYIEADLVNYDSSSYLYDFQFKFETNDVMNEDNYIRIDNLIDIGTENESYGYVKANTKTIIYILSKQDAAYGRDDADIYIPNLNGYTLSNKYSLINGLDFFYNYSDIISSTVNVIREADDTMSYMFKAVPVVRQTYINNDKKIKNFIYQLDKRKEYINYSLSILEDSFGIDFKFFNTYGPSNSFNIDDNLIINRVNLSMRFRVKVVANTDKYIKDYITRDIKNYIEDINEISDIHIPNLVTVITNKYREQLVYFEFIDINGYGPGYQHIYHKELINSIGAVPEFLNINTSDEGNPDIDIILV